MLYKDRVLETSQTTGTGTLTLDGAEPGYQGFGSDGEYPYALWQVDSDGNPSGAWETGIGQYTSSGSLFARLRITERSDAIYAETSIVLGATASGTGTSISTNAPAGVQVGERLVLVVVVEANITPATPTGWTQRDTDVTATHSCNLTIWDRVADGTANDTPTVTLSSATYTAIIVRLTGKHSFGSFDVCNVEAQGSNSSYSLPVVSIANKDSFALSFNTHGVTAAGTSTLPGWNMQEVTDGEGLIIVGHTFFEDGNSSGTVTFGTNNSSRKLTSILVYSPPAPVNLTGDSRIICTKPASLIFPQYQLFDTPGTHTWVKPPGCKVVEVILIGGGGGGGSGRKGAAGGARTGGAGGGGGGLFRDRFLASQLGAVESVVVGAGGPGGVSQTADSSNGSAGTAGGGSTFYNARAAGGGGGGAGIASNVSGGSAGGVDSLYSRSGNIGGATHTANGGLTATAAPQLGPTGGGGGGCIFATDVISSAGAGGSLTGGSTASCIPTTIAGGAAGTGGGNGSAGNSYEILRGLSIGTGGGGGHAAASGQSGNGANGANYGAGGGGGAAALDSGDTATGSGAGGNGAGGAVMVISY